MPRYARDTTPESRRGYVEKTGWDGKKIRSWFSIDKWDKDFFWVTFVTGEKRKIRRWEVRFF